MTTDTSDTSQPRFPEHDIHALLVDRGFEDYFVSAWVELADEEEVARRLGVDPGSGMVCDLPTAMRRYRSFDEDEVVWIGRQGPAWTQILHISGFCTRAAHIQAALTRGGVRLLQTAWNDAKGVYDLDLIEDGRRVDSITEFGFDPVPVIPPDIEPRLLGSYVPEAYEPVDWSDRAFGPYAEGLDPEGPHGPVENLFLIVIGRMTGRFLDEEWLAGPHRLYRIPKSVWAAPQ